MGHLARASRESATLVSAGNLDSRSFPRAGWPAPQNSTLTTAEAPRKKKGLACGYNLVDDDHIVGGFGPVGARNQDDTLAPTHDAKPLRPFRRVGQEFTTGAKTLRLQRHHAPVQAHTARHFLVVADPDNRSASPLI